ncbi:MAG: hypothetical protein ACP5RN_05175 [Armatimonadota bacterium]
MRYWCMDVVSYFGASWNLIGWGLFLSWFLLPFVVPSIALWLALGVLLLIWWVIDAVDQEVAWWKMMVVVLLLAAGFLPVPHAGWLTIAAWVVYYLRFRE